MPLGAKEQSVADFPRYCLAHERSENFPRSPDDTIVHNYDLHRIEVPRPANGQTTATIVCGTCGRRLSLTVSSRSQMHSRRRRKLAAGLTLSATGAGYFAAFGSLGVANYFTSGQITILSVLAIPVFLLVIAGIFQICGVRSVTGVELQPQEGHEVRRPGSTVSVERGVRDINPSI
jgi:hypothetical protein